LRKKQAVIPLIKWVIHLITFQGTSGTGIGAALKMVRETVLFETTKPTRCRVNPSQPVEAMLVQARLFPHATTCPGPSGPHRRVAREENRTQLLTLSTKSTNSNRQAHRNERTNDQTKRNETSEP
jgi:hypothetical protein